MIVERFPADRAGDARVAVLPREHDGLPVEIVIFIVRRERQVVPFEGPFHALRNEGGERFYIQVDARAIERG